MTKPLDEFGDVLYPEIASSDVLTSKGSANKARPNSTIRTNGWDSGEIPTCNQMNYQFELLDKWIKHLEEATDSLLLTAFPIGSIYLSTVNTAPTFGGTWVACGEGRMLVGAGTGTDSRGDSRTFNGGDEGGEYAHALSVSEMPSHNHPLKNGTGGDYTNSILGASGTSPNLAGQDSAGSFVTGANQDLLMDKTGGSQAHNNIPPYLAVYMFERMA